MREDEMDHCIRRAAVLGAGTMGATIAAHLANAGIPVMLLDIPAKGAKDRNAIVKAGLERASKNRPSAFMLPQRRQLITVGNFDDDLKNIRDADWIIEAVIEKPEVKQHLWEHVEKYISPWAIASSNSSGIQMKRQVQGRSDSFKQHFLGTHFFNPPRYLYLLEVVPIPETAESIIEAIRFFADRILGKGVVIANDVPGFIANRIGARGMIEILRATLDLGLSVDVVDALMGQIIGRPKSAIYRTNDITGIDLMKHVAHDLACNTGEDFTLPTIIDQLIERNWLGEKTGQGFYKRTRDERGNQHILTLNLETLEYENRDKVQLQELELIKKLPSSLERHKALLELPGNLGEFMRRTTYAVLHDAAMKLGVVANSIYDIDNALKWGFGWENGAFELCDALGLQSLSDIFQNNKWPIPQIFEDVLSRNKAGFYATEESIELSLNKDIILLRNLKRDAAKVVRSSAGASILDIGDGVALLEYHSKANSLGEDAVKMAMVALEIIPKHFIGLVIGNQGNEFSAGANLTNLVKNAQEANWDEIDRGVKAFQEMVKGFRYAPFPVVAAPHNMTLGGGCELCLWSDMVQAHAELYIGLVEVGVGLIPAGGGTTEMLIRFMEQIHPDGDEFAAVKRVFELIALTKVSGSALEARSLGFLRNSDRITMNKNRVIADAKKRSIELAADYVPPTLREIKVLGESAFANLRLGAFLMNEAKQITEYEVHLAMTLAKILSGGTLNRKEMVPEQYLLDLEREAFLHLCGQKKTRDRIRHLLETGKILRN